MPRPFTVHGVGFNTLEEAVNMVNKNYRNTTIIVGKGEHKIDGAYLMIPSAMNIVGDPKVAREEIVIKGGIQFTKWIGMCHLQHLTLRRLDDRLDDDLDPQAKKIGVVGYSSFTMKDVLVEKCGVYGVWAQGTGVVVRCINVKVHQCGSGVVALRGASIAMKDVLVDQCVYSGVWAAGTDVVVRCINVKVRKCGASGVVALDGASITLVGKTEVHDNCKDGWRGDYGLIVWGASTIELVSPLTKETVSINNGGGGDCGVGYDGDINQIRNADAVYVPETCKTLKEAVNLVHGNDRLTTIIVGEGKHKIDGDYLEVASAMRIVGDPWVPRDDIVIVGGILFKKLIGMCHLQHLTLRQAKKNGVLGESFFTMEDVLVEQCGWQGVFADRTVGRCTDVEVRQCKHDGVAAFMSGSVTLQGPKTKVHHNCTKGESDSYGLNVHASPASILLVSPLTKEQVSFDNGGGGNWGANDNADIGEIKTISKEDAAEAEAAAVEAAAAVAATRAAVAAKVAAAARGEVRVPETCKTLKEAVDRVHGDNRLTTIIVGKGEHQINSDYLYIASAMNLVGDPWVPRDDIEIVGGIGIRTGIQGNCHLQHLTVRQAKKGGVLGGSSFTMEDVLVEQSGHNGVGASGIGIVCRCTNVEVRQCTWSGVIAAKGASITLIGDETMVHGNCTKGISDHFGLQVYGASTIELVSPLTKEKVSFHNRGSDWGAARGADINQIRTAVRVPEDCATLNQAVNEVQNGRFTTIIVGKGEHPIDSDYLEVASAMRIVGDPWVPRDEIVIVGGIEFNKGIGMCHLQRLTLRSGGAGVFGWSSFTMKDVLVEKCVEFGVGASGTGVVGLCTDVEVCHCGMSGVVAQWGASITLIGAKTKVHHNCTNGHSGDYGLLVAYHTSTIQLVSPLTREQVSYDNGGGGNLGAWRASTDQIEQVSYDNGGGGDLGAWRASTDQIGTKKKKNAAKKNTAKKAPELRFF